MSIGKIIPRVIKVMLIADIAMRFLPIQLFAFRAWEAVMRFPIAPGPFTPNMTYSNAHAYGDLAGIGNLKLLRQYREEIFTTNATGFRVTPEENPYDGYQGILIGDSFTAGSGLSDSQTLAAELDRQTGSKWFNAGGQRVDLTRILTTVQAVHPQQNLIIYPLLERTVLPTPVDFLYKPRKNDWKRKLSRTTNYVYQGLETYSPLEISCHKILKHLQNDHFLPNEHRNDVRTATLKNGQSMIFLPLDLQNFNEGPGRPINMEGILKLRAELASRDLRLMIMLVPNKYTVYAPLLDPPNLTINSYLNRLESALKEAQIPVINLLQTFQSEAARELGENRYIYLLDDTHWNQNGVAIAAKMLCADPFFKTATQATSKSVKQ